MALRYYANAPATTLAAACTNVATTIQVASVTGLPVTYPYTLILDRGTATEEVVDVTNAAGTTLTVSRGADSTTAFAHDNGAEAVHGISARDIREANAHINATGAVHGLTGSIVGTSDTQALTNKDLSSGTNTFPSSFVTLTGSQTLTNKTLALGSNSVSGTTAQFNAALSDGDFATLAGFEILTNKSLVSPLISGVGELAPVVKSADQSRSGTTVLASDSELTVTLQANATYQVECLVFTTYTNNTGYKWGLSIPAGATLDLTGARYNTASSTVLASLGSGSGGATTGDFVTGIVQTAGSTGSLTVTWAQSTAHADNTTVKARSYLKATRIL